LPQKELLKNPQFPINSPAELEPKILRVSANGRIEDITAGQINDEDLNKLKLLYALYFSPAEIAEKLELSELAVLGQIKARRLDVEREKIAEEAFKEVVAAGAEEFQQINTMTVALLKRHLRRLMAREEELEPKEVKFVSEVLKNTYEILQLERGMPTSIVRLDRHLENRQDIRDFIQAQIGELQEMDPMIDYKVDPEVLGVERQGDGVSLPAEGESSSPPGRKDKTFGSS
jgi:hypothetical protein